MPELTVKMGQIRPSTGGSGGDVTVRGGARGGELQNFGSLRTSARARRKSENFSKSRGFYRAPAPHKSIFMGG